MTKVRSRARQRLEGDAERGSALVIALVFLVLTGVLVAALVAEATPSFETTRVVKNIQDSVVAADAGVEYGIQTLRADSTVCSYPGEGVVTLPAMPAVNGHSISVTCQASLGYAAGTTGWGVITNDAGLSSITDQAVGNKSISGPVFNAGGWTLSKPLTVRGGKVNTRGAGCTTPISNLTVIPAAPATFTPFTQQCTPALAIPVPAHALPSAVPGLAAAPTPGGGCTMTLYPGHYTTANPPPLAGDVYMASGVYYFDDLGSLNVGTTLFGGQPPAGESRYSAAAPCRATDPAGADGAGVEIILGGSTSMTVGAGATMELYTRTPATNDGSTPGISIYQVPATSGGWAGTTLGPSGKFLVMGTAATVHGVVHGAVYGPMGSVSLTATNAATAAVTGGVDIYDLTLQSSAGGIGLVLSIAVTTGLRYAVITSVAAGVVGEKDITSRAVIQIANDALRTVQIDSWGTQQDG